MLDYRVIPFIGNSTGAIRPEEVARQLESSLNSVAREQPDLAALKSVSISVSPGCIGRLMGREESRIQFDQFVMGSIRNMESVPLVTASFLQNAEPAGAVESATLTEKWKEADSGPYAHIKEFWDGLSGKARLAIGVLVALLLWWVVPSDRPSGVDLTQARVNSGQSESGGVQSQANKPSAVPRHPGPKEVGSTIVAGGSSTQSLGGAASSQVDTKTPEASASQSRATLGSWQQEGGGSTCASTKAGRSSSEITLRIWYCGDETTDRQLSLSYNPVARGFVDDESGLVLKFLPEGKVEISSPETVRRVIFGQDGFDFLSDMSVLVVKK